MWRAGKNCIIAKWFSSTNRPDEGRPLLGPRTCSASILLIRAFSRWSIRSSLINVSRNERIATALTRTQRLRKISTRRWLNPGGRVKSWITLIHDFLTPALTSGHSARFPHSRLAVHLLAMKARERPPILRARRFVRSRNAREGDRMIDEMMFDVDAVYVVS